MCSSLHLHLFHHIMSKQPGSGSLKDLEQKRREVFKPILDNPYTKGTEWPSVSPQISKSILDYLLQLLSSYGEHRRVSSSKTGQKLPPHALEEKVTIGFNSTVKALENQAAPNREKLLQSSRRKTSKGDEKREKETKNAKGSSKLTEKSNPYVKYVFVAKSDVTSPLLTSCFPLLTFSASKSLNNRVKLVELPRGALEKLGKVLHEEKPCFISLTSDWAEAQSMFKLIDANVSDVQVPWLEGIFSDGKISAVYEKPAIQFLKTSAPIGKPKKSQKGKQAKRPSDGEKSESKRPKRDEKAGKKESEK